MNIKTLLIDDEPKALAILKTAIEKNCPSLKIIGFTQSPVEGLKLINKLKPQLVFLDIAMPSMSGFDVLELVAEPNFEVVFVTAFDSYAIEAIRHCAIGYLVKPIDILELKESVQRAKNNIEKKVALPKNRLFVENLSITNFQKKQIVIPVTEGLEFIKIMDIIFCEGMKGYTKINLVNDKSILSTQNIGYFIKTLANKEFYQVHKSYLLNLNYLKKYLNEGVVISTEDHSIPVSRSRRNDFVNLLKNRIE